MRTAVARRASAGVPGTVVVALAMAVFASACGGTAARPADPALPKVEAANPIAREITEWDEFTGRVEAVHVVELRPRVSGYIVAVRFREGGLVRRGDVLFEIDPRPFQAEVDRLRAQLVSARATADRAVSEEQRGDRLAADNALSREERERRATVARESNAQIGAVQAALREAELNLEWTKVTAPIDGRVSRAIVREGNLVSNGPSDATLLTTVVSLDPIYATFDADERSFLRYLSLARQGKNFDAGPPDVPIQMALANDSEYAREGRMFFLDNRVDPTTGTIRIRAIFRNADHSLTPGLFARLRIPGGAPHSGILIQDRAIGTDLDKRFVLVVGPDGVVQYRAVTLGPLVDNLRVVRSGLTAGDLVVVNGLQRVRPGARVEVQKTAMDAQPATEVASTSEPSGGQR